MWWAFGSTVRVFGMGRSRLMQWSMGSIPESPLIQALCRGMPWEAAGEVSSAWLPDIHVWGIVRKPHGEKIESDAIGCE